MLKTQGIAVLRCPSFCNELSVSDKRQQYALQQEVLAEGKSFFCEVGCVGSKRSRENLDKPKLKLMNRNRIQGSYGNGKVCSMTRITVLHEFRAVDVSSAWQES